MAASSIETFARLATLYSGSNAVTCNYSGSQYQKVWGIIPAAAGTAPTGTIQLQKRGSIAIQDLARGVVTACVPQSVTVSAGTVYLVLV